MCVRLLLAIFRGAVVVLTETEGEWWHGHLVEAPDVVGMFPSTYVARGTSISQRSLSAKTTQPLVASQQRRLRITKAAKGFGMGIEDDGVVSMFTFHAGNPAISAGVQIGARIVAVAGVPTAGKAAIIGELQHCADQTPVEFTFEHVLDPTPGAIAIVEPEPEPSMAAPPPVKSQAPSTAPQIKPDVPAVPIPAASGNSNTSNRAVVRRGWLEKKGGDTHIDLASNVLYKERHYSKGGRRSWKPRWFIVYADGEIAYFNTGKIRLVRYNSRI